ncbi:hypothetical protein AMK21_11130 [Streptomyces sp. CB00316]|nr:hypothetical protein AMK21_11130 [Streptomyces sp. CB00316]
MALLQPAYVHLEATAEDEILVALRRAWPGALIMNPVLPMGARRAERADAGRWLGLGADLISFGRAFIANFDLVERLRAGLPLAAEDAATYFEGGDAGYVTYPAYQHAG